MTPHISAKKGDFAKLVLMPGDPLRAKFIAENFLDKGYKLVNSVRNMLMYTGTYKGHPVTVAGSGMGCPSIGIYSYELFKFYGVEKIIRIGSSGSYVKDLKVFDTVLVESAYADSNHFRKMMLNDHSKVAYPSKSLTKELEDSAKKLKIEVKKARTHSCDAFYSPVPLEQKIAESHAQCVEMEAYALFTNAEKLGKQAACLLTISDSFVCDDNTSPEQRQTAFTNMMKIALELALKY